MGVYYMYNRWCGLGVERRGRLPLPVHGWLTCARHVAVIAMEAFSSQARARKPSRPPVLMVGLVFRTAEQTAAPYSTVVPVAAGVVRPRRSCKLKKPGGG